MDFVIWYDGLVCVVNIVVVVVLLIWVCYLDVVIDWVGNCIVVYVWSCCCGECDGDCLLLVGGYVGCELVV